MVGLRFSNVMDIEDYKAFPGFDDDARTRRWNLWGYIDARDGAQAVRRGPEAEFKGFEPFILANADPVMSRSDGKRVAKGKSEYERVDLGGSGHSKKTKKK